MLSKKKNLETSVFVCPRKTNGEKNLEQRRKEIRSREAMGRKFHKPEMSQYVNCAYYVRRSNFKRRCEGMGFKE